MNFKKSMLATLAGQLSYSLLENSVYGYVTAWTTEDGTATLEATFFDEDRHNFSIPIYEELEASNILENAALIRKIIEDKEEREKWFCMSFEERHAGQIKIWEGI